MSELVKALCDRMEFDKKGAANSFHDGGEVKPREWKIHGMVAFHDRPGGPPGNTLTNGLEGEVIPFGTIVPVVEKSAYDELLAKYNFMVDSAQQNASERDILLAEALRLRKALNGFDRILNKASGFSEQVFEMVAAMQAFDKFLEGLK